jgi:hypothetical protein
MATNNISNQESFEGLFAVQKALVDHQKVIQNINKIISKDLVPVLAEIDVIISQHVSDVSMMVVNKSEPSQVHTFLDMLPNKDELNVKNACENMYVSAVQQAVKNNMDVIHTMLKSFKESLEKDVGTVDSCDHNQSDNLKSYPHLINELGK